jgi:stalled ribosome rescue protein Dom34
MHISPEDVEKSVIHTAKPHAHLHAKSGSIGSGRTSESTAYYHAVAESLTGAQEILVVGPAQAKLQLIKHMHAHHPKMAELVIGVESVDHPTDGQLIAYARKYFIAKDMMLS